MIRVGRKILECSVKVERIEHTICGRSNNRIKIYNKKIEANLDRELTRIEITSKLDIELKKIDIYHYNVELPKLYLNNYLLTFDDIEDKTLLAIVYAVQNRFPS